MKRLRITPLNIVAALAVAFFIVSFFKKNSFDYRNDFSALYQGILGALIVVCFIIDLIFRFILKNLKKVWLIELFFIAFTVIMFLIIKQ